VIPHNNKIERVTMFHKSDKTGFNCCLFMNLMTATIFMALMLYLMEKLDYTKTDCYINNVIYHNEGFGIENYTNIDCSRGIRYKYNDKINGYEIGICVAIYGNVEFNSSDILFKDDTSTKYYQHNDQCTIYEPYCKVGSPVDERIDDINNAIERGRYYSQFSHLNSTVECYANDEESVIYLSNAFSYIPVILAGVVFIMCFGFLVYFARQSFCSE